MASFKSIVFRDLFIVVSSVVNPFMGYPLLTYWLTLGGFYLMFFKVMRAGAGVRPADRAEAPKGLTAPPFQFVLVKTDELFEVASKNTLQ